MDNDEKLPAALTYRVDAYTFLRHKHYREFVLLPLSAYCFRFSRFRNEQTLQRIEMMERNLFEMEY